jgi:hypothetical protein
MLVRAITLGLTLAASAVGCAHFGKGSSEARKAGDVAIEVNNDFKMGSPYSVYLVKLPANRKYLGDVPPGQRKTFVFHPDSYSTQYRLIATAPLQPTIRSVDFTVIDDNTVEIDWNLYLNSVDFMESTETH